ncbi:MAG: RnfABCDGE type electron transport complex subunit B [Treponema sp.]|jgi:Na+-translocating ferredoxin:NAD+ oxidoreductase RNF subunit RnfB|nr:RnfABCDGE type electron transport complex subunit B [Treponema sp.]
MIEIILIPVICVGSLALLFGVILGLSAKKFAVQSDPKVDRIISVLPGANCGGCGYPGCTVFAERVAEGKASYRGCPPGGQSAAAAIAKQMGVDAAVTSRKAAYVKCGGTNENIKRNYIYDGPKSCVSASQLATGGNKTCRYSCIGLESCKNACPFNAIKMVDSIAVVITEKCSACGKCVKVCPKNLIEIVPDRNTVRILCNSRDKGRLVRENCRVGCIGCLICQKACKAGAITVADNIAHINYDKCTLCMECVQKCPSKVIKVAEFK